MRKIESAMIEAIENQLNWQSANTQVINSELASDGTVVSVVKLHGHKIAVIGDTFIQLFDGGWQTATTKSRLNAILKGFGVAGEGVFQKQENGSFVYTKISKLTLKLLSLPVEW
jgi:hypothetical protein